MSWHYSQALVAEYLADTSLDGEQFAPLRESDMPETYCWRDRTTESLNLFQFGMMSAPSTVDHGAALLTWYREAFLVLTSVPRGRVKGLQDQKAVCGKRWSESFARWDRDLSLWKTRKPCVSEGWKSSCATWPKWGLMQDGECWELVPPDIRTTAEDAGSWPTPSGVKSEANHFVGRCDEWGGSSNRFRGTRLGSMCLPRLEEMLMGWPMGWTELTPFEMDRFQKWRASRGRYFPMNDEENQNTLLVMPAQGGVHRWAYGRWTGTAHLPTDGRAAIRFEWDQSEVPPEWEDVEEMILEEIC